MTDRLNDYTSFAGAPEDAESSVKFVYKTAETVAAADTTAAETETVKEGNIFTRLWQRIVNLFKFPANQRYLEGIMRDVRSGKAHFAPHDLIEEA